MKALIGFATLLCFTVMIQNFVIFAQQDTIWDLQDDVYEQGIEDRFLARKMQELKEMTEADMNLAELHLDLAVSGFRTGSYRRYVQIRDEAIKNGVILRKAEGL